MHRNVDGAWTRELIRKMREKVPGVVLRTTMIVGHPGEGKKDFNELLEFAQAARFERLGAFMYSEEEGTFGAENFKDTISARVKQERLDELMRVQSEISLSFNQSRIGSDITVIVDDYSDGVFVCRSEFESPEVDGEILVKGSHEMLGDVDPYSLIGEFIKVRVTGADEYDLIADILEI
jgi:ribosomal protein S12 methylthiotransferase